MKDLDDLIEKAVEKMHDVKGDFGVIDQTIEEMAELIQALIKHKRGYENRENLVEEYADVMFMFMAIGDMFDITPKELDEWFEYKANRILERAKKGVLK